MFKDAAIASATKSAIKVALTALREAHPGEPLIGYSLITDDNLGTIGHAACSEDWLRNFADESARFEPVEWTYCAGSEAFDEVRTLLTECSEAAANGVGMRAHVEGAFNALVAALAELKAEGLFDDSVFLTVVSTDPSPQLLRLEGGANIVLNSESRITEWMEWQRAIREQFRGP